MKPANLNGQFDPDDPPAEVNSGDHPQAPPGVFLAAGPHIRKLEAARPISKLTRQDIRTAGSVMDITSTLLAMMRVPLGDDMEGRVLSQIFRDEFQVARQPAKIATHDTEEFLTRRHVQAAPRPGDAERLRQLRGLGYIE